MPTKISWKLCPIMFNHGAFVLKPWYQIFGYWDQTMGIDSLIPPKILQKDPILITMLLRSSQPLEYLRAVVTLFTHGKFRVIDASGTWFLTVCQGIQDERVPQRPQRSVQKAVGFLVKEDPTDLLSCSQIVPKLFPKFPTVPNSSN
jgi:hypothetical protein